MTVQSKIAMHQKTAIPTKRESSPLRNPKKQAAFVISYMASGFFMIPLMVAVLIGQQRGLPALIEHPFALVLAALIQGGAVFCAVAIWDRPRTPGVLIVQVIMALIALTALPMFFCAVAMAVALVVSLPFRYTPELLDGLSALWTAILMAWGG